MFSLSRLFFFGITDMLRVDSWVFLIFTTRVDDPNEINTASDPFTTGVHSKRERVLFIGTQFSTQKRKFKSAFSGRASIVNKKIAPKILCLRGKQARANELIAEGDGYTFIAAPRSPDLRHTSKRRRHLCYCERVSSTEKYLYHKENSLQFVLLGKLVAPTLLTPRVCFITVGYVTSRIN